MVQEGSTILSFVLIWTIVIFIHHVEGGPMVSDHLAQIQTESEAVSQYFTVHQVTHISRRRRDDVDHVVFPKMMVFDLEFNDRKINLRLKKHDYMTGDIQILTRDGPVQHDMGRKTGVYQDSENGASFVVQCEDYNEHCTLQGSMMIDNEMWVITPEKDTQQLHKAVQRQNGDKTKKEFGSVPLPSDFRQEDFSSRYISDVSPRKKRAVPANCKIVQCYAIVDETVWDLYFNLSGRVTATAEQDIAAYYLALYTQADKHFEDGGTIRNGFCLRLYFRGVSIQKTRADSWSVPAEVSIPGATPLIAFVEAVAGLNECGTDGNNIRNAQGLSVNTFQCFTRKDLVWNERSGTPNYFAFYRSLAYRFMVCEAEFLIYQSSVVESNGDDVEVLVAKVIAQACGSVYDSETTNCADTDFYINARETLIASDSLKQRNVWYFSTCTLQSIEGYLNSSATTCLDGSGVSHAEYDTFINQPFAGRLYSWEEQCVNRFGNNSRKCDPTGQNRTFFDDMCSAGIYCTNDEFGDGSCVGVTRPFEGTPCGTFGSYCLKSECLILHGLGENCTCHDKCNANFSFCDTTQSFTCRCQSDYYDDDGTGNIGGNCVPKVTVGQPCPQPDACLDPNAVCSNLNCTCIPGFYEENGACFRLLCFGDVCNNTYQCQGDNVECSGSPSTCRCPSDRYFNVSTGNCDERKDLGTTCEEGQCLVNNSVCGAVSGVCECQEEFYDTNDNDPAGRCELRLSLGTICPVRDSCEDPNAECMTTCMCKSDFFNDNGVCARKKCIGESCFNVTDCSNTGAECSGSPSTCRCPDGTFLNETTASCDTNKNLGMVYEPGQCGPSDTVCDSTSSVCKCQEGLFDTNGAVTMTGACEAKLGLGTTCVQPDSCADSSAECSTPCQCLADFYNNGGTFERQRSIGETCVNVSACLTTGAECSGIPLLCQCPDGTFLNDTTNKCDSKKDLGISCESGQCAPMDSKCDSTSYVCECQEGFFDTDGHLTPGGNCSTKLNLGTPFTQSDSCEDSNAGCSTTCQCVANFYINGGTCERQRSIGETCVNVTACLTTGVECSGTPLLCQCPDGTCLNDTTNICDRKKDLGSPCEDGQCAPTNSVCDSTSNVCECQEGFFDTDGSGLPGGSCSAKLSLGIPCAQSDSCADPNAECSTICQCIADFYNNGGICERQRSIGETCVNVSACLTTGAECSGIPLLCQCPDGTFLNDTTNKCDIKKDLGISCEPGQCAPMNSKCDSTSTVCECQEGFFDTDGSFTSGGNCSAKLSLGTSCIQSDSCADPNAECSTTCQCIADFYNNGGTCERQRSIGETCVNVTACLTTGAECSGTPLLCQCPDGTFLNDTANTCDSKKDLGRSCEPGQCAPMDSKCDSTSNVCECQEGFFDTDGRWIPGGNCSAKLSLGTACTQADSCADPNAECSTTCQCIADFYNNGGTCERQRSIGETCVNVSACLTTGAECSGTPLLCQCPDGTFLNDTTNTCDSKKDLGRSCEDGQCAPANSVCDSTSNVCECQEGFFDTDGSGTAGGNCSAKLSLGTACTQSDSCADPNAECSTTCQCIANFYNNGGTCERQRSIGESCVNVTACLTTGAGCSGTPLLCQCPDGTFLNDTTNTCDSKKDLGSPCEDGQCAPANSVCDSTTNVCECQGGFFDTDGSVTAGGNCSAKLDLGASCTQADSCSDPNAVCSTTCQCQPGFYNNGGTCSRQSGIGESCVNVTGCLTPGAECSGSPLTCRCPDSTFLNDTDGTCDAKKGINETCETGQCADPNAVCQPLSRTCTCGDGYTFNNTACVIGCPNGFEAFNTSCYFFGDQESLYSTARTQCFSFSTNTLSSSLVQVDTTEELDYLKNFMLTRGTQPTDGYWNDLFETTTNGNETWRTSGDPLVISDWNSDQPDDRGEIQLCTMFFKTFNYKQADIECLDPVTNVGRDNRKAFALCEINLPI